MPSQVDAVEAGREVEDRVAAGGDGALEREDVPAGTADHPVRTTAAGEIVVLRAAGEIVVAVVAEEEVVADGAAQDVGVAAAEQAIRAAEAVEHVVAEIADSRSAAPRPCRKLAKMLPIRVAPASKAVEDRHREAAGVRRCRRRGDRRREVELHHRVAIAEPPQRDSAVGREDAALGDVMAEVGAGGGRRGWATPFSSRLNSMISWVRRNPGAVGSREGIRRRPGGRAIRRGSPR